MRRSRINQIIEEAIAFVDEQHFFLPRFAYWTPNEWRKKGEEVRMIIDRQLGWDVTEFGQDKFDELGLVLFTLRNGAQENLEHGKGMLYSEKAMIVGVNQVTPMHYHWLKTEDIINRGGGRLAIQLYTADDHDDLGSKNVSFVADGTRCVVPAGHVIALKPGESITITPGLYHSFWAEDETVLAGEVSTVNDDSSDNRFLETVGRFPSIDEDEPPRHLLVTEYRRYVRLAHH